MLESNEPQQSTNSSDALIASSYRCTTHTVWPSEDTSCDVIVRDSHVVELERQPGPETGRPV